MGFRPISASRIPGCASASNQVSVRILHSACRLSALSILVSALICAPARSQTEPDAVERQRQVIEREQRERLREEQDRAQREKSPPAGADLRDTLPQADVPALASACRDIREIRFAGDAGDVPPELQREIRTRYAGRCLGTRDLEAILATVTKRYIDRGYITTRAYLASQDLRDGTLEVTLVEGRIERFDLDSSRARAQSIDLAFPTSPGERLNLRDLEQGIDQINSLSSNKAKLALRPGSEPGQSVVVVENRPTFPLRGVVSLDNSGMSATGRNLASVTLVADGVLGYNEMASLTRRQSIPDDSRHESDSTGVRFALPLGYFSLSLDASRSDYSTLLRLPSGRNLTAQGRSINGSMALDWVAFRNQSSRASLSARLANQSTDNWLNDIHLDASSRTLSTLELAATAFSRVRGGVLSARLAYLRGLTALGALRDAQDLPRDLPHAQFGKIAIDLGYSRPFAVAGRTLRWATQFSGQKALDTLYGSQQMVIGSGSTVRGFRDNVLSGDDGYYLHNELSLPWGEEGAASSGRVYAGYDIGHVASRAWGVESATLSGASLGAASQWNALNLDVSASRALRAPTTLEREGTLYGMRLSVSF